MVSTTDSLQKARKRKVSAPKGESMALKRSLFAGTTGYFGATIEEITDHIKKWRASTLDTIKTLKDLQGKVKDDSLTFENPGAIMDFVNRNIINLERYASEFARLEKEIGGKITAGHVESFQQMYEKAVEMDKECSTFKQEQFPALKNESFRYILDDIYRTAREQVNDYLDLSNLVSRLKALVG